MIPAHFLEELGFHLGLGFARGLNTIGEQPTPPSSGSRRRARPAPRTTVRVRASGHAYEDRDDERNTETLFTEPEPEVAEAPPENGGSFKTTSGDPTRSPSSEASPTSTSSPMEREVSVSARADGLRSWEDLRPKHALIGVRRAGQPSRQVDAPVAPELVGRFVTSCAARCQHTGKRCNLPAGHASPHRHGRTPFVITAVEGQTYFPGAAALDAMATSRPDAIVAESDRRTRPEEKVEVRDWKRRCVVCRKPFTERGPHPKKHCCGQKCAFVVIKSGLDQASYARREGVSPNAETEASDVAG